MRRTSWKKVKDLSDKIEWQFPEEKAVATWTTKAIDRSMLLHGGPCIIIGTLCFLGAMFFYLKGNVESANPLVFGLLLSIFMFNKLGMEKTVFVYRATDKHLEICQWQDIPDLVFTFLRAFPFIFIGVILMLLISSPGLSLLAFAGPALVGIFIAGVGSDADYKKIYKKFRHSVFEWKDLDRGILDVNKGLLAVSVKAPNNFILDADINFEDASHHRYLRRIYFRKTQEKEVVNLFERKKRDDAYFVRMNYKFPFI